jgi:hypothetical protein
MVPGPGRETAMTGERVAVTGQPWPGGPASRSALAHIPEKWTLISGFTRYQRITMRKSKNI